MPPHCDSLDGPVVRAAMQALALEDAEMVLPYVHSDSEQELRQAFDLTMKARTQGAEAREVADRFFAVPSTKAYGAVSVLIQLAGYFTERWHGWGGSSSHCRIRAASSMRSAG